jgi:transposase
VKFSERRPADVQEIGLALIAEKNQMFEWWHRVRDGTLSRATFRSYMAPLKQRVADLLGRGVESSCAKTQRTCARLL